MNGLESFRNPSFACSSNSSNPFTRMNSPSAFGMHSLLPTQSVQLMSTQRNLVIPLKDMGPVGHGGNLLKDAVPESQQDACEFTSSGNSHANIANGGLSGASKLFPSGPSVNSFANISNGSTPLATSIGFPFSHSGKSYASILRSKMLGASRGIPFDADNSFENIADGEMLAPSSHLPVQSYKLANQPLVQIKSSSADLFNKVAREAPRFSGVSSSSNTWNTALPSKFPDLGHKDGTCEGPSQGNSLKINQLSRLAASSVQTPTFGNEFQNQMAELMRRETTPVVGFSEQVAPFNLGSNANSTAIPNDNSALGGALSIISTFPNLQNCGGGSDNVPEKDGTVDQ
ncbi:two-component response regulator ORR25-like isoform X1 [Phragmites australis]|uniref:two-component response regulator ORR25-like isoform X1 n=1 Tax=Phragmites australis TaxID=29695 RepID=UPI002D779EA5|nr:two-component response regulator ORR25-like isoform X1 [Phragmites australis]